MHLEQNSLNTGRKIILNLKIMHNINKISVKIQTVAPALKPESDKLI